MSLLSEAVAELYGTDPEVFTARRKELAAHARKAGDAAAAKEIAALGKPTRSAWLINRLVRADPGVPGRLAELAGQLSEMPGLDAAAIRQLTVARRQLVDALVRQATREVGGSSAALRDEIADTFNAALADPEVAGQVEAGTLVKAAHWAGFGFGSGAVAGPAAATVFGPAAGPGRRPSRPGRGQGRRKHSRHKRARQARARQARARRSRPGRHQPDRTIESGRRGRKLRRLGSRPRPRRRLSGTSGRQSGSSKGSSPTPRRR